MVKWLGALVSLAAIVIANLLFVKLDERFGWAKILNTKLKINSKVRVRIFGYILIIIFIYLVFPSINNNSIYYYISYGIFFGFIITFGQRISYTITPKEDIVKKSDLNKADEAENKKEN